MRLNPKLDKFCKWSVLIVFLIFWACSIFFYHSHYYYGDIITHSHPYKSDANGRPTHTHTNGCYLLIHALNNYISTELVIFLSFALLALLFCEKIYSYTNLTIFSKPILGHSQRGPPELLISL